MDLSLVIACYKDGAYLEKSLQEIEQVLAQTHYTYELILIDDCSPDGSAEVVRQAAAKRSGVRCVLHSQNVGRGGTVAEGMRMARGNYVGFLDIDLEVHSRYIPAMLLALEQGFDGATAHRFYEIRWHAHILFRHILSQSYHYLVRAILGIPYKDTETGYKFFRREKILPVLDKAQNHGWFWDTEIMTLCHRHGLSICEIPVLYIRRPERTTTVKPLQDSWEYLRQLLRFRRQLRQEDHCDQSDLFPSTNLRNSDAPAVSERISATHCGSSGIDSG